MGIESVVAGAIIGGIAGLVMVFWGVRRDRRRQNEDSLPEAECNGTSSSEGHSDVRTEVKESQESALMCPDCEWEAHPKTADANTSSGESDYANGSEAEAKQSGQIPFDAKANSGLFRGRMSRFPFLTEILFLIALWIVLCAIAYFAAHEYQNRVIPVLIQISVIPLGIYALSCCVKRWHDLNMSGLFAIVLLIPPVSLLVLLLLFIIPGSAGPNRFGPVPGEEDTAAIEATDGRVERHSHTCPHCGVQHMAPMSDGRCPNCKEMIEGTC